MPGGQKPGAELLRLRLWYKYMGGLHMISVYSDLTEQERAEAEAFKAEAGQFFDVRQAALILGVSTRTVNNYIKAGRLQGVKVGGKWRFAGDVLQRFLRGDET